jgi:hypothetical protein
MTPEIYNVSNDEEDGLMIVTGRPYTSLPAAKAMDVPPSWPAETLAAAEPTSGSGVLYPTIIGRLLEYVVEV